MGVSENTYHLTVDLDSTVNDKLPGLPTAACKHGSVNRNVDSPLQRCKGHVHVRCWNLFVPIHKGGVPDGRAVQHIGLAFQGAALDQVRALLARVLPWGDVFPPRRVPAGASACGLFRSVGAGHVRWVHVDHRAQTAAEHAFPLALADVFAVIGAGKSLCRPFLLEEGSVEKDGDFDPEASEVVEVVLVPGGSHPLQRTFVSKAEQRTRGGSGCCVPPSSGYGN